MDAGNLKRLEAIASNYYAIDFPSTDLRDRYEMIMALPAEKSDNASRVARVKRFASQHLASPSPRRILDVGAGLGVFLARFLQTSEPGEWDAVAVETDPLASRHLAELQRFPVVTTPLPCRLPHADYDLCTLNKVLEHVAAPLNLLRAIRPTLQSSSGLLYVEVPDKTTIFRRPATDNILGALHCHLYSAASLSRVLELGGFRVLQVETLAEPSGKFTVYAFATPEVPVSG